MSSDEEQAAIGRLVQQASESKKMVTLLKENLEAFSASLTQAGLTINGVIKGSDYSSHESATFGKIPTPERIEEAVAEFRAASRRAKDLSESMQSLGITLT